MVTDKQVRMLMKLIKTERTLNLAASKAGMDEKTARKYLRKRALPSQQKKEHTWRTREDPFEEVWSEVRDYLESNPSIEGTTIFSYLQREYPGKFSDGQLRTLQRKIRIWRALEGPGKEVFFPQEHKPGQLSESSQRGVKSFKTFFNDKDLTPLFSIKKAGNIPALVKITYD